MEQQVPPDLVATATDLRRRTIHVTQRSLDHIAEEHPELSQADVMLAIARADRRTRSLRGRGREMLWARKVGRWRNLVVVVAYSGTTGTVITAYPPRKEPKEADLI
jgi:hypothetical protein